jgi:hypothetical protein
MSSVSPVAAVLTAPHQKCWFRTFRSFYVLAGSWRTLRSEQAPPRRSLEVQGQPPDFAMVVRNVRMVKLSEPADHRTRSLRRVRPADRAGETAPRGNRTNRQANPSTRCSSPAYRTTIKASGSSGCVAGFGSGVRGVALQSPMVGEPDLQCTSVLGRIVARYHRRHG